VSKTGILLHTYHLGAVEWEGLVWGNPETDELGTVPTLADTLLDIPSDEEVASIICNGPSEVDGVLEGDYTKNLLLSRIGELAAFPRIGSRLEQMSEEDADVFRRRLGELVVGPSIRNTATEIEAAAQFFREEGVTNVLQIAAATHAPRVIKEQGVARMLGIIPPDQRWRTTMSDTSFAGSTPADVVVAEPPHRGDDPMRGHSLSWPATLKRYQPLGTGAKLRVLQGLHTLIESETDEEQN
jgi:hypothetical protein